MRLPDPSDPLLGGELELFGDEEDEDFLAHWAEAEAAAVDLLRSALRGMRGEPAPEDDLFAAVERIRAGLASRDPMYRRLAAGAGWSSSPPASDAATWVEATAALIAMREEAGLPIDEEAAVMALQLADWLGAVLGLVRAGVGAIAEPAQLVRFIAECPELDDEIDDDDRPLIEQGFEVVLASWEATGAVDADWRLTPLGHWGLPRALAWAWNGEFDAE